MLPEAAGREQHFQDLGYSFSQKRPTSRPITNIASGSKIKKQGTMALLIIISFNFGAKKVIPHYKKLM